MTALRVMPPSSAAIWEAERPSDQSFFSCSTRSSVHVMGFSLLAAGVRPPAESDPVAGQPQAADVTHHTQMY
jgi:hypothetical protein